MYATHFYLTDMKTYCKVSRSHIIPIVHIEENRFGFEPEIPAKVVKYGWGKWAPFVKLVTIDSGYE